MQPFNEIGATGNLPVNQLSRDPQAIRTNVVPQNLVPSFLTNEGQPLQPQPQAQQQPQQHLPQPQPQPSPLSLSSGVQILPSSGPGSSIPPQSGGDTQLQPVWPAPSQGPVSTGPVPVPVPVPVSVPVPIPGGDAAQSPGPDPVITAHAAIAAPKRRVSKACDHCRKRKIKCDRINPLTNKCTNCTKYGAECTFTHHELSQRRKRNITEEPSDTIPEPRQDDSSIGSSSIPMLLGNFGSGDVSNQSGTSKRATSMLALSNSFKPMLVASTQEPQVSGKGKISKARAGGSISGVGIKNVSNIITDPRIARHHSVEYLGAMGGQVRSSTPTSARNAGIGQGSGSTPSEDFVKRVEKIDKKLSLMADRMLTFQYVMDKLLGVFLDSNASNLKFPKARKKRYYTRLLTTERLGWSKSVLAPDESDEQFFSPIGEITTSATKWFFIQARKLVNVAHPAPSPSSVSTLGSDNEPVLPTYEQSIRLLEHFCDAVLAPVSSVVTLETCLEICEKYHKGNRDQLSFPELLFLNVCLCYSAGIAKAPFYDNKLLDALGLNDLLTIEHNSLLNAIYYYHKVSVIPSNVMTIQGLLLLHQYVSSYYSIEFGSGILQTAVNLAFAMELNISSHYGDYTSEQSLKELVVWWQCFRQDQKVSLIMSRPPFIKESDTDIDLDESYLKLAKYYKLAASLKNDLESIEKIKNIDSALTTMANYCEHTPFVISYYINKLSVIEGRVNAVCFTVNSSTAYSFDETLQKLLELQQELDGWKEDLPTSMGIRTYKHYFTLLYPQFKGARMRIEYEIVCLYAASCHMRFLHTEIMLCLFVLSFLMDNVDLFEKSTHIVPKIIKRFKNRCKDACTSICELFLNLNREQKEHMYPDLMYYFLSGVFVLLFHVITHIDDTDRTENKKVIQLLKKTHSHLVGEDFKSFPVCNMKQDVGVFYFTFLLKYILKRTDGDEGLSSPYGEYVEKCDILLENLIETAKNMKIQAVELVVNELFNESSINSIRELAASSQKEPVAISELGLFGSLSREALSRLYSSAPIKHSGAPNTASLGSDDFGDVPSLFVDIGNSADSEYLPPASKDHAPEKPYTYAAGSVLAGTSQSFRSYLPAGRVLYDRDFLFFDIFEGIYSAGKI